MTRPVLLDLHSGGQVQIDKADLSLIVSRTLYLTTAGYVAYSVWRDGASRPVLVHRLICAALPGQHVDHVNGDKLDLTRTNLRAVTPQINQVNRKRLNRNNTSGVRGVSKTFLSAERPWRAQITVNRKNIHLGLFETREDAVAARIEAELHHYGEECPR